VVFIARNPVLVQHFNRVGHYRVHLVTGQARHEIVVGDIRAVSTAEPEQVAEEMAGADLIGTAVGVRNLPDIAPLLAAGLRQRHTPVNVFAFENGGHAGQFLRDLVSDHLPTNFPLAQHGFSGALVSRAVSQRLGEPAGDNALVFVGDPPATFVVDGQSLRQPLPAIMGMIVADNYTAWEQRKLYIYSAGHATAAYLGFLKGYHYIHTAIRDPEIRAAVLAAMAEGQQGLAAYYGPEIAGDACDLQELLARFENASLNDPIVRVGRDPRRKLGATERLVGAARLAAGAGINPEKLALAAAAALCFYDPADPLAVALHHEVETAGLGPTLSQICDLDPHDGLGGCIAEVWQRLASSWQPGNLLLSLERNLWAWEASRILQ
jgi:mannitol-1-phosphate 5-dehydrogenase